MSDTVRLDKWLWAARFFKTRGLAREAVQGGKVQLDGRRVKPARAVRAGDRLEIHKGEYAWCVEILEVSERRGPAPVAQALYEETEESRDTRERLAELRRLQRAASPVRERRPDKRSRRQIIRFRRGKD